MLDQRPATQITLQRHILEEQRRHPGATGELSIVLTQIALAGKIFAHMLARAPQAGFLGATGDTNVQGESTKKLDVLGNQTIVDAFARSELVALIVSEEDDAPRQIACGPRAKYVLCIDPLDGSSNSDVNGTVGTIFGLYRPAGDWSVETDAPRLRSGGDQVAAGYIMYGPSTAFVYTTGAGAHGFTLDRDIGEFLLTHPNIACPERGPYYSANLGHVSDWPGGARRYIEHLAEHPNAGRSYSLRYSGALVADVHRCLLEGGIYLYPCDRRYREGKLRLLYECAPLAFVVEQAGGAASTGRSRVLDVRIESIHQRVPLAIGSRYDVLRFEEYLRS
jgi:fructose-1,6-bisphosphatase I